MKPETLEHHWKVLNEAIDLAMSGRYPMGLDAVDANTQVKTALLSISEYLESTIERDDDGDDNPCGCNKGEDRE